VKKSSELSNVGCSLKNSFFVIFVLFHFEVSLKALSAAEAEATVMGITGAS
jgi:hypothetical protein